MKETLEFVLDEERQQKIKELIEQGYRYRCIKCNTAFKEKRQEFYEDGHGGRFIDMCRCGCDLFQRLDEISYLRVEVKPVDGTLVFKEHHAKYCKCEKGKIWTGDAETECWPDFELLEEKGDKKVYKCLKSNLKIVILKSTEDELKNPDELGSTFLRWP